jgi:hypothetical protein
MLLPYKYGNYIYLKDNSYIGVYDTLLSDYVNINTGPSAISNVNSVGISPNGNIWAGGYQKVGIFNGTSWQYYSYNGNGNVKVINDTSAYISGNPFIYFHNGVFDSLFTMPQNTYFRDWDVDSHGGLWIAGNRKLIHVQDTVVTYFDSTNAPIGTELFRKVVVGKNGHVWTCGDKGNLFEYDGANWSVHSLMAGNINIDNFNLDSLSHPWVIAGGSSNLYWGMSIYVWNGSSFNSPVYFRFMPYQDIKEISPNEIATEEGVFNFGYNFQVAQFHGNPDFPEATDVNCFRRYSQYSSNQNYPYGTHTGIYNSDGTVAAGLDTSMLPNDTVNYLLNDYGSDYVCTNNGLLVYNGVFYNTFNSSNSPLPSNKITFANVMQSQPYNILYIGTDNGIAIYANGQWTVLDSISLGLSNFYVTGILPPVYDTITYISTMGSGLIKIFQSGGFEILNTTNGNFQDDSLYYVMLAELPACVTNIMIGTNSNGIAFNNYWNSSFQYYNISTGYPFTQSRSAVNNGSDILIGTNAGLWIATPCGGISENSISDYLTIYPNPGNGVFTIGQLFLSKIEIYNIIGEVIYKTATTNEKITIDLSRQAKGIYFIKSTDRDKKVSIKKLIIE